MSDEKSKTPENLRQLVGRPMLHWIGKTPLQTVRAFPGQLIEQFSPDGEDENPNLLLHGDNKDCLSYLAINGFRGRIDFVYIDPPFNTGSDNYVRKVKLRGSRLKKVEGESMSVFEQTQYANAFFPDLFLQSIFERLQLLGELMTVDATIAVRIDYRFAHYIKILLDEVFGPTNFVNEILVGRQRESAGSPKKLDVVTESIFVYSTSPNRTFNKQRVNRSIANTAWTDFLMGDERFPRERVFFGKTMTPPAGQHYPLKQEKVDKLIKERFIRLRCMECSYLYYYGESTEDLERYMRKKENRFKFYDLFSNREYAAVELLEKCLGCSKDNFNVDYLGSDEESVSTNWTDIASYASKTGYPTENSEILLERLINTYSNKGNLVLDCFIGSGTTAAAAQKLGRRWIGCDINKGAIQTTSKRLQNIIKEQAKGSKQAKLPTGDEQDIKPVLSFKHYRVNDYDLQIQHNEALELALEFVGVVRKRSDGFFEGELGKNLVKVVPFTHPCTMLDIELIKTELKNRPDEDRNITVISLGKDANVSAFIDDHNKRTAINKVNLIDLRTDPKHGNFLIHEPAWATIDVNKAKGDKVTVEITDFLSPTIIKRLQIDQSVFRETVSDFRSMIDIVLIDTNYDGKVFNIAYSDVPTKRTEFVKAAYELDLPKDSKSVAVKVIDMLGEEVFIVFEL